jgi:flagellar assembly protein FliH
MSDQTTSRVIKACTQTSVDRPAGVLNLTDIAASARAIITDARKQAAKIVADARLQTEQLQRSAIRKAHAEGFAAGQNEGFNQGKRLAQAQAEVLHQADTSELAQLAKTMIGELSQARKDVLDQAGREMLSFAIDLASKIVGHVAAKDLTAAQHNLDRAIKLAQDRTILSVRCNPQQVKKLQAYCEELMAGNLPGGMQFIAEDSISAGGVKVFCDDGQIDAAIESQWQNVVSALLGDDAGKAGTMPTNRDSE